MDLWYREIGLLLIWLIKWTVRDYFEVMKYGIDCKKKRKKLIEEKVINDMGNFVSLRLTKIKEPRRGGKNSRERGNR